jgi:hypothetical protein
VIDFIVHSLPKMLDLKTGDRTFIVDYVDCPVRYFHDTDTNKMAIEYMQLPPVSPIIYVSNMTI